MLIIIIYIDNCKNDVTVSMLIIIYLVGIT